MADFQGKYIDVKIDGAVAIVNMKHEPVNSMGLEFWEALLTNLTDMERHKHVRALIYMSGVRRHVFTAGNDIKELYAPKTNQERHRRFWLAQTRFLSRLYKSPLISIACIRGACPAGGCIMSLCCDYRIMADIYASQIGLNEVALGIAPPLFWCKVMEDLVGHGLATRYLTTAKMIDRNEALSVGLIDEIVPIENLLIAAFRVLNIFLKMPASSFALTKYRMRGKVADAWEAYGEEEAKEGWQLLSNKRTVKALGAVLQRLSKKSSSKTSSGLRKKGTLRSSL